MQTSNKIQVYLPTLKHIHSWTTYGQSPWRSPWLTGEEQSHLQGCGPEISARERRVFSPFVFQLSFSKARITLQVAREGCVVPRHFPNTTRPSDQGPNMHIQYLQHDSDPAGDTRDYCDSSNNCSTLTTTTSEWPLQLLHHRLGYSRLKQPLTDCTSYRKHTARYRVSSLWLCMREGWRREWELVPPDELRFSYQIVSCP